MKVRILIVFRSFGDYLSECSTQNELVLLLTLGSYERSQGNKESGRNFKQRQTDSTTQWRMDDRAQDRLEAVLSHLSEKP